MTAEEIIILLKDLKDKFMERSENAFRGEFWAGKASSYECAADDIEDLIEKIKKG